MHPDVHPYVGRLHLEGRARLCQIVNPAQYVMLLSHGTGSVWQRQVPKDSIRSNIFHTPTMEDRVVDTCVLCKLLDNTLEGNALQQCRRLFEEIKAQLMSVLMFVIQFFLV